MNQEEIALQLLRRMVEIPSLSGQEKTLAEYLVATMQQLGFRSYIDQAGNAIGERGDEEYPLIMLLGHMDTVSGFVEIRQEGSDLYGRGTVDAKGPLATCICAAALSNIRGRLVLVGAVEEEAISSRGANFLLDRYKPDAVIIAEPSGASNVVLGYKGRMQFSYVCTQPASHVAGPDISAAEKGIAFWNRLTEHLATFSEKNSAFYRPIAHLLKFDGTDRQACLEIDCRIPPNFDTDAFQQFLQNSAGQGELHIAEVIPAVLMERSNPVAVALFQAIRKQGEKPGLKIKTGTSDMNVVSQHWQVPMVAYGPGDSHLDHTDNEHLDLNEYLHAIHILSEALSFLATSFPSSPMVDSEPEQTLPQNEAQVTIAGLSATEHTQISDAETDTAYSQEEEEEIAQRLQALGYLE